MLAADEEVMLVEPVQGTLSCGGACLEWIEGKAEESEIIELVHPDDVPGPRRELLLESDCRPLDSAITPGHSMVRNGSRHRLGTAPSGA